MAKKPAKPKKVAKPQKVAAKPVAPKKPEPAGENQARAGADGRKATQFKPGQSGNPAGRPPGTRNRLCNRFLDDLQMVWTMAAEIDPEKIENLTKGQQALLALTLIKPGDLVKAVGNLMPREHDLGEKTQAGFGAFLEAMRTGRFQARKYDPGEDDDI
jgi:hypothetical protein